MIPLLLGLALKSAIIAAVGLAFATAFASRPAAERVTLLRIAVGLLLALPVIALASPDIPLRLLPAPIVEPTPLVWAGDLGEVRGASITGEVVAPSWSPVAALYAVGVILVLGHFIAGICTLWIWTRTGRPVTEAHWIATLERLTDGGPRPRLVCAPEVETPLSWGVPPGAVLIGREGLARIEDAEAVLAHEIAHIRRRDWLFLALSRLALALFWFNPLVWRLHATLAACSEEAADAVAVLQVDRRLYARVLVGLAAHPTPHAAIAIAGDARSLKQRIATLMKTPHPIRPRPLVLALTAGALIAVATPLAAVEIASRDHAGSAVAAPAMLAAAVQEAWRDAVPLAPPAPPVPPAPAPPAPPAPPTPPSLDYALLAPPAPPAPPAHLGVAAPPAPPAPPGPPAHPAPPAPPAPPLPQVSSSDRAVYPRQSDADPATRAAMAQARIASAQARTHAAEARTDAISARTHARADHERIAASSRAAHAHARGAAALARTAEVQAAGAMANARVHMRAGADQMVAGAREMRETSSRLRDPEFRARQIVVARERGEPVTDERLQALIPELARQADELEAQAEALRRQSETAPRN